MTMSADDCVRARKWSVLFSKKTKIQRLPNFAFRSPDLSEEVRARTEVLNVLFVCTMNQWRSPTAEEIYRKHPLLNCRSAGTSRKARKTIRTADIRWADLIVMMEDKHWDRLSEDYRDELEAKECHVLAVEDRYREMDEELISELHWALDPLFLVAGSE